jgi:acyl-CoA thioesterase-1
VNGRICPFFGTIALVLTALTVTLTYGASHAQTRDMAAGKGQPGCTAPSELTHLTQPLRRLASRLGSQKPIRIVAIGSSSTAGAGASSPAMSYPSRLEVELRRRFPLRDITVVNRGANGEEARDMIARFDESVIAEKPDLVLWQVGANAVLRDEPVAPVGSYVREGIRRIRAIGADLILIDPQFAPKVLAKVDIDNMVDLLATIAKEENVGVFQRFAVMRHWRQSEAIPYRTFLSPDELHMNDWGYGCVAHLLAGAIADAAVRPTLTAGGPVR